MVVGKWGAAVAWTEVGARCVSSELLRARVNVLLFSKIAIHYYRGTRGDFLALAWDEYVLYRRVCRRYLCYVKRVYTEL